MAAELIRDTAFGHIVRLVTRNKVLQYEEEKDPSLWKRYLDREKSTNMAQYGVADPPPEIIREEKEVSDSSDPEDSATEQPRLPQLSTALTNVPIDPEKGRDIGLVGWWGDKDPEVRSVWHAFGKTKMFAHQNHCRIR